MISVLNLQPLGYRHRVFIISPVVAGFCRVTHSIDGRKLAPLYRLVSRIVSITHVNHVSKLPSRDLKPGSSRATAVSQQSQLQLRAAACREFRHTGASRQTESQGIVGYTPIPTYPYGKSLYKPYIVGIYGL